MTSSAARALAALATTASFLATGFEAHLVPLAEGGVWHGITGQPTVSWIAIAIGAGVFVAALGRFHDVRPFFWMGTGLLPLIPALSGRGVVFLVFGHATMVLVFFVLLGITLRNANPPGSLAHPVIACALPFVFFLFVGRFLPGAAGPQGDEPHYLMLSQSLLRDGDVDLKNQFDERSYRAFTGAELEPHTAPRSPRGTMYSVHTPGLAALIAPGYAVAGYTGARAIVSLCLAVTISLLGLTATRLFGASTAATIVAMAALTTPFPVYANALFPDSVAPLAVASTLATLVTGARGLFFFSTVAIASLPWMHPRFLPLALILAAAIGLRDGLRSARLIGAFVPLGLSTLCLLWHFKSIYGSPSLSAAYGPGFASDVSITRIPQGALGLTLDAQFGLLLFAPLLLLASSGARALYASRPGLLAVVIAAASAIFFMGASFSMWWGGASAPARFTIGATPALLVLLGARLAHVGNGGDPRRVLAGAAGFGAGLVVLAGWAPRALHNRLDRESGLLRLLSPAFDLDRGFPFLAQVGGVADPSIWDLGLAIGFGASLALIAFRPRIGVAFGVCVLATGLALRPGPFVPPLSGGIRLLERWHDHRRPWGGNDSPDAVVLEVPMAGLDRSLEPGVVLYSPRFSLPAGVWTLEPEYAAEVADGVLNTARLSLVGPDEGVGAFASLTLRADRAQDRVLFELPNGERRVHLRLEGIQSRTRVTRVRLRATALTPPA